MENKSCMDCRFGDESLHREPCRTCRLAAFDTGVRYTKWEPEKPEDNSRPKPMPGAVPYYERESSRIPERIRISFTDGTTAVYDLHVDQPAPVIIENIKIIRRMKQGYVNQPARRRNRK